MEYLEKKRKTKAAVQWCRKDLAAGDREQLLQWRSRLGWARLLGVEPEPELEPQNTAKAAEMISAV